MKIIQTAEVILSFPIIVSPRNAGAFTRDFIKHLSLQGGAFTGALKFEKLKAPLFPGPGRAGDTNDWCITGKILEKIGHWADCLCFREKNDPRSSSAPHPGQYQYNVY